MKTERFRVVLGASLCLAVLVACATDRHHKEGLQAFDAGEYEKAISSLQVAVEKSPGNATYRLDLQGKRTESVRKLIAMGDAARSEGSLDNAKTAYNRVLAIEPGNARARRGLETLERDRRHVDILKQAATEISQGKLAEAEARIRMVLAEDPGSQAATSLRTRLDGARGPQSVVPQLRSRDNRPVTLQFRDASTKMVFEVLARQTGINFIFDKEVKSDGKTTIFVQDVPVEQAIDLVLSQNQLGRQVMSENMVMVYPNTPAKQREYQSQVVKTFYVTNSDAKKVMEMIKTMLGAKTLYVDERASAVVMRDTPDTIRMAERLISAMDIPESEVMMEVEVLELTRSRLEQLGIRYPQGVTITPTPLAGDPLVLKDLTQQDSTTLKVSDVTLGADIKKSLGTTNVLASPRIRARNHEKAKVLIGQRVPVITTSTVLTTGGSGSSSNVQYVDVGLTLDVEPTVYLDSDVAIKVNLEVSTIQNTVRVGDSLAYQIGTRNATTLLRLKDGETQILAGLISDQDRRTSDRIPGLGDIPLLGRLFGTQGINGEKSEIVLSITPRIIRMQPRPASENTEFWYGTEASAGGAPLALSAGQRAGVTETRATRPASTAAASTGTPVADVEEPSSSEESDVSKRRPVLSWNGPGEVSVGQSFDVTLQLSSEIELSNIRSMIRYDSAVFELAGADAGTIVPTDKGGVQPVINQPAGRAQLDVPSGVHGDGSLLVLHFKAVSARPASMITVQRFAAVGADGQAVPTMAPRPLTLQIKQ